MRQLILGTVQKVSEGRVYFYLVYYCGGGVVANLQTFLAPWSEEAPSPIPATRRTMGKVIAARARPANSAVLRKYHTGEKQRGVWR